LSEKRSFSAFRLLPLAGILGLNVGIRSVLGPFLVAIEADMDLSHSAAGALLLFLAAGYAVSMLLSGFVAHRLTHRRTIVVSIILVGMGAGLTALVHSLWLLRWSIVFLGAGAGLYIPSGMATIYESTPKRHWGKAVAIHELGPNLSLIMGPLFAEMAMRHADWRAGMATLGASCLLAGIGYLLRGSGGRFPGEQPRLSSILVFARERSFWAIVAAYWLVAGIAIGGYAIMPLYLVVERGLDRGFVNSILGLSRIPTVAVTPLAGWLADRWGPRRLTAGIALAIAAGAILLALVSGPGLVAVMIVLPLFTSCFFPVNLAALAHTGPRRLANVAVSVVVPTGFLLGGGLVPSWLGVMGDQGLFYLGYLALGIATIAATIPLLLVRLPGHRPGRSN
jgi:NNP family nitrate/nitrite transporter-like MFS transporter